MADSNKIQELFSALMESNNSVRANVKNKNIKHKKKKVQTKSVTENVKSSSFLERALESMSPRTVYEDDNNEIMDDVIDNVAVVTDPEKSVDDLEVRADEVQDAIEGTPEGEEAFSDEYVGDKIYACPICGESFFADDAYHEGDICPICKAEPSDGFLNQGTVVANTEAEESEEVEPVGQEASEEEIPVVDVEDEIAEDEDVEDSEEKEESAHSKNSGEPLTENMDEIETENCNDVTEDLIPDLEEEDEICDCEIAEECNKPMEECSDVDFDEKSFECLFNEFLQENYKKSVKSMKVEKVVYNKVSDKIRVEGIVRLTNGANRPVKFELSEKRFNNGNALLSVKETTGIFKVESKSSPFMMKASNINKVIKFESMRYSYQTSHPKVGKVIVEGVTKQHKKK